MSDEEQRLRILVVEDEANIAAGLKLNLELEDFEVEVAATARLASQQLVSSRGFDVILLDVMLPDMDGFEFCRRLRASGNLTPVIMLTARNQPHDRVHGLEVGADDYLSKPFEIDELLARVRSLVRRMGWAQSSDSSGAQATTLNFGEAEIDFETHEVQIAGERVELTRLELDLVRYFADNAGRVIPRDELLAEVWDLRNYPNTRTVDNFIVRLRRYFEKDPKHPVHFLSVRGSGYKFVPMPTRS